MKKQKFMTKKPSWMFAPMAADHLGFDGTAWFFLKEEFEPGCYQEIRGFWQKLAGITSRWESFLFVPAELEVFEARP